MELFFEPGQRDYRVYDPHLVFGLKNGIMTQHLPYSELIKITDKKLIDSYLKFAFTRNTWDRLVSAYCYLKNTYDRRFGGFDGWLLACCRRVQFGKYHPSAHFAPQTDFIFYQGRVILDFIGRFESLQSDFSKLCVLLNAPLQTLQKSNRSIFKTMDYRHYYSRESMEMVRKTYAREIDFLNYKFD